jgi:macrolide transport system ATP-binding/permease protein
MRDTARRGLGWLDDAVADVRYGVRMLRRNPGFTAVAVLALAIGIGVDTAVFTAYKAIVARPLGARNAGEMVNFALSRPLGSPQFTFSYPDYEAFRDSSRSFTGLIAFMIDRLAVSEAGNVPSRPRVQTALTFVVSENYFKVLGVNAIRGRTFDSIAIPELVASPSVLISEDYWQTRFSGDPSVLGKTVRLNGAAVTVIGITSRDFAGTGMSAPDLWLPMSLAPLVHADDTWLRDRESQRVRLFGRLAPGVTAERAQAEMTILADRVRSLHDPRGESATPATAMIWRGSPTPLPLASYRGVIPAIVFVLSSAAMVLLVACANVASLQLARARSRVNELQTRASLGASRLRVIRQLLTESALLGMLAGIAALSFTWALLRIAVTLVAGWLPPGNGTFVADVTPDLAIFAYVFAISLVAGILFGLPPAVESSRAALGGASRAGTASARSRRIQDTLIAVQVGLSLVFLIVGSLLIRGAINAIKTDPGYDDKHLVMLKVQPPEAPGYTADRKDAVVRELRTRLATMPGVVAVTDALAPATAPYRTAAVPLDRDASTTSSTFASRQSILHFSYVEANYFQTIGVPFVFGSAFAPETGQTGHAVVLSESAARELWPGRNPIGRSVRLGATDQRLTSASELLQKPTELLANGPAYQVIGVVQDIRGVEFDGSGARQVYLPMRAGPFEGYPILIRTRSDPAAVIKAIDPLLASIDPDALGNASSLGETFRQSGPFLVSTLSAAVASTVGLFGLLLASMGIYGTVSYVVLHRTREIGIRMALGARARDVLRLVLGESTRPVVAGLMVGLLFAVAAAYLLRGLLYGVSTVDGVSFVGTSLLFLAIALLAAYAPARRAATVDPNVALRYE